MNMNNTISILQNNDNETVTLIALPLQIFQQASQQHSLIVEQNLFLKSLPDGTFIIDTNQLLNGNNNLQPAPPTESVVSNEKSIDDNEPVLVTIEPKNDLNNVTNKEETVLKVIKPTEKEDKGKQKVRYLNNKTSQEFRKPGRPKKDSTKSKTPENHGPYKCSYCEKEFQKWILFKRHEKTHINEKKYKCWTCPASFNILSNHVLHLATHNTDDPTCPECGKKFQRIASLKAHLTYHEKEEMFYCEECDMSFNYEVEMIAHLKEHGKEKKAEQDTLQCKYCQLTFTVQSEYKKHMSEHSKMRSILQVPARKKPRKATTTERKHQCAICQKSFQKRSQIERHMRVHSGEKPYVCKICNRGFSQKGSLQIHMTRHTGIKPHKCALCPAKFSQKGNLRAHILKTHSVPNGGDNVFSCSECSCVFKRLGSLNGHMTRCHPKQKTSDIKSVMNQLAAMQNNIVVDNDILQQAIIRSDLPEVENPDKSNDSPTATYVTLADLGLDGTMRRYVIKQRRVNDIRWHLCSFCPKEFKKPSDLVRHIRVHTREKPYKCKLCFRSFAVKSTLTTHIRTHTQIKKVQCKICFKYFCSWSSLNVHVRKHTGQKPHKCTICSKAFRTSALLKHHCQVHLSTEKNTLYTKESNSDIIMQQPIHITSRGLQPVSVPLKKRPLVEAGCKSRPYSCVICNAGFRKLSHLKQHHIRHTGERPFRCHMCFRNFSSSGVLKSHILTHNGTKPYNCIICDKNFSTNGSLRRHLESHKSERPYLCPYCLKDFKTVLSCRKHMKIHRLELNLQLQAVKECGLADSELIQAKPSDLPYPPDLTDALADDPFSLVQTLDTNHDVDDNNVETDCQVELPTHTLQADETGTVVLPVIANQENLTQENMREIEDTLNNQMLNIIGSENFANSNSYVNKINPTEPIVTTDELANILAGTSDPKPLMENQFMYPQVIVNLQSDPEQMPMFDNTGIENILSQVKLQNDSLYLTDFNSLNISETNNVLLPFQMTSQSDLQQNQLIMIPPDIQQEMQQSTAVNPIVNMDTIDPNIQLKLNAMNTFLQSTQNLPNTNIVLCNSSDAFLAPEDNIVHESLTHIPTIQDKMDADILPEDLPDEEPIQANEISEAPDNIKCNLCNVQFKTKTELKVHQCLNFTDVTVTDNSAENNSMDNLEPNEQFSIPSVTPLTENVFQDYINQKEKDSKETTSAPVYRNQCTYCPKSFRKPSDLQRHIRTHTGERPFQCDECSKSFSLKSTLESHNKIHQGRKEFTCHVCNCLFASKGSLSVHMRLHTGAKPFKCPFPFCQLKFRTSGHRKAHHRVHYKEALRTGKLPGDIITRKAKMSELMDGVQQLINADLNQSENKENPSLSGDIPLTLEHIPSAESFNANQVNAIDNVVLDANITPFMQFEVEANDQGHIINIKPSSSNMLMMDESLKNQLMSSQLEFDEKTRIQIENLLREKGKNCNEAKKKVKKVCSVCQKEFATKYLLDRHSKIHTGEKVYSCTHCSKTFNQKNALEAHLRTHLGTRPYSCPFCSNTFSQSGNLKTHIKRIHSIKVDQVIIKNEKVTSEFNENDLMLESETNPR